MPYVTSGVDKALEALSYTCRTREEALAKAIEIARLGADNVSVTDVESGEVLTGEEIVAAVESLPSNPE